MRTMKMNPTRSRTPNAPNPASTACQDITPSSAEMAGWPTAEPSEANICTRPNMRPYLAAANHLPPT